MTTTTAVAAVRQEAPQERLIFFNQALREAIDEEMQRDPAVFVIGEEVGIWGGAYKVTEGLLEKYGESRIIDTPISEALIAGAAVGASITGLRPIAEFMYSDFMGIAMDQIVNQAAKNRYMFGGKATLPIVYRASTGAGIGNAAQHTQSLEAWFTHIPGLKVVAPSTPYDAKGLLKRRFATTTSWYSSSTRLSTQAAETFPKAIMSCRLECPMSSEWVRTRP